MHFCKSKPCFNLVKSARVSALLLISAAVSGVGCATSGKQIKSLSGANFKPVKSEYRYVRKFDLSDKGQLLMGESGIYEYTIKGLQKRPVLTRLYPEKTFKGLDADALKQSLREFSLTRKPFLKLAGQQCKTGTHLCGYLRDTREIITLNKASQTLEIAKISESNIDANEETLLGSAVFLDNKHADLYAAIDAKDSENEQAIIKTLGTRLQYEKLWKRFSLPRHKQLLVESLRATSTLASQLEAFELTNSLVDYKRSEKIAQSGTVQDRNKLDSYSTTALATFLARDDRDGVNYLLQNHTAHIDFTRALKSADDKQVREHAISHYRSVASSTSFTDAFLLSQDTDDLLRAKELCTSPASCKNVEKTLLDQLKALDLEIVVVDNKSESIDYNRTTSETGLGIAQAKSRSKNIAVSRSVRLNPEVLAIGILDSASLIVTAEIKLSKEYLLKDNIYGRQDTQKNSSTERISARLTPENNFKATLNADFRVLEFEVVGSKMLDAITDFSNSVFGTNARADITQELTRVSSSVDIINVRVK